MKPLASTTFYAVEDTEGSVTEVVLSVGFPEKVSNTKSKVAVMISANKTRSPDRYAFGVDDWQALMSAISMLKLQVGVKFGKRKTFFYRTRDNARKRIEEISLDELFPKTF